MTRPPTTIAVRDATVGPLSGTSEVSTGARSTSLLADAQLRGHELREDGLGPLAHLGRAHQDGRPAVGVQVQVHDALELDLAAAREPGAVPGERQTDAGGLAGRTSAGAARATRRRALPGPLELRGLRGPIEDLLPRDALAQDLLGRRHVPQLVDPAAAQRERRHAQRLRDPVGLHLRRELGLGRAESPERAVGRRVGGHRAAADAHVRAAVRAAGVEHAP